MNQLKTVPQAPQGLATPIAGAMTVSPQALIERVKAIEIVRQEVMQENVHYYSLDPDDRPSDKRKWSLGKAGAEVLNLAFGLCSDTASDAVYDDPEISYTFRRRYKEWFNGPNGRQFEWKEEDINMKGRYEVKATCRIYDHSGNLLASASGSANSWESAFRGTAYADAKNPVLKRAEKRAYVAATLQATASSSMFTQDVEDMDKGREKTQDQGQGSQKGQTSGAGGWMSEPQKKLIYAKAKKANLGEDVAKHMIETLNAQPKGKGKPVFDAIADGKPEAEGYWQRAMAGVKAKAAPQESPAASAPSSDPGPDAPEGAPASDTNGTAE